MPVLKTPNDQSIEEAAALLKDGGLVGMPTETVYGLAGNALDGAAVARIYEAKGRPAFNPLIAHFPSAARASHYAEFDERALALAAAFWPGPLTLVLPLRAEAGISELATAGLDTIAVRVPDHKVAQALLAAVDFPLVAPSANKSGALSPTSPAHVADSLGEAVDMILAAGACKVGLESTVLDLSGDAPVILRPGAVTAEQIRDVLSMDIFYITQLEGEGGSGPVSSGGAEGAGEDEASSGDAGGDRSDVASSGGKAGPVKSPGMLLKHYAPETPLRLSAIDLEPGEALLAFGSIKFMGVKGGGAAADLPEDMRRNLSEEGDLHEAAANLFAMLKALDGAGAKSIAVMAVPDTGLGVAINDRLRRAAES